MTRGSRKRELLEEGARLFSRQGYAGTSLRDLADATNIRAASIYAHFDGKEQLFAAVMSDAIDRLLRGIEELADGPGSPEERIVEFARRHTRIFSSEPVIAGLLFHSYSPQSPEVPVERRRDYEASLRRLIDQGIADGSFSADVDTKMAATALLSMLNWTYCWYDPRGPLGSDEIADEFSSIILSHLRAADTLEHPGSDVAAGDDAESNQPIPASVKPVARQPKSVLHESPIPTNESEKK